MESAAKQEEKPAPLTKAEKKRNKVANNIIKVGEQIFSFGPDEGQPKKKARYGRYNHHQLGGASGSIRGGGMGRGRGVIPDSGRNFLDGKDLSSGWVDPFYKRLSANNESANKNAEKNDPNQKENHEENQIKNSSANQEQDQGGHGNQDGQNVVHHSAGVRSPLGEAGQRDLHGELQHQQGGGQDGMHGLGGRGVTAAVGHGGGHGGPYQQQRDNRNRSGGGSNALGGGGRNGEDYAIAQRLLMMSGPSLELPPVEPLAETKFSGRNRLYVGNLSKDIPEEELREMFKPYGEIDDIFINSSKNFAFLRIDYHLNAEKAKRALDGTTHKGRQLRVRFAPNSTIVRVSNLTQYVTNELLHKSFEIFGPIERATITVDDRGRYTGEGVVEFVKKSSALACLRLCGEKCFFLTASLRPCIVEPMDVNDDSDGLPEKTINRKSPDFFQERSIGPRFADRNSFEHEYGSRWKQLHHLYKSKHAALKRQLHMEEEKLEAHVEYARYDQETEFLRQELRQREINNERKKLEWEMRERQVEAMRKREEESMRCLQAEMQNQMRRREENTLFMQAQRLNSMLDQEEIFGGGGGNGNSPFQVFGQNFQSSTMVENNTGPGAGLNAQDSFALDFGPNNMNGYNGRCLI